MWHQNEIISREKTLSGAIYHEQNSNKFRGCVPLVEVVEVSKLNNYCPPQEKKKYQNCTIPLGFPGAVSGVDPWGSK